MTDAGLNTVKDCCFGGCVAWFVSWLSGLQTGEHAALMGLIYVAMVAGHAAIRAREDKA